MRLRDTKYCPDCKTRKSKDDFYKTSEGYFFRRCKLCHDGKSKQWIKDNPDKRKASDRKRKIRANHNLPEFLYNKRLAEQGYKCAVCGIEILGHKAHLDHNHVTGKHRGFLCFNCNTALGLFKDSPVLLRQAALYLERHNTLSPE
jgi:rubredoxin